MRFYKLNPEVAGQLGDRTIADFSTHPPVVRKLHYELDDWLGDDLITSFPCFVLTDRLARALAATGTAGWELDEVEISRSQIFEQIHPDEVELPGFQWLKVSGTAGADDVGMSKDHLLVVSDRVFGVMRRFHLDQCEIEDYPVDEC